jgi:hypothetical protein
LLEHVVEVVANSDTDIDDIVRISAEYRANKLSSTDEANP